MIIVRISFPVDPEKADKVFEALKAVQYVPDRAFTYPTAPDGSVVPTQTFTVHLQHAQIKELDAVVNSVAEFDVRVEVDGVLQERPAPAAEPAPEPKPVDPNDRPAELDPPAAQPTAEVKS